MIELYAITAAPPPNAHGLTAIEKDGLAAIGAPAPREVRVATEELWRREAVIECLMHECDLLPVRYGTVVNDEEEAERLLVARREELLRALERVSGAVELAVRVAGEDPIGVDGGAYMHVKTRLLEMHETLAALSRQSRELAPGRSAYLVSHEDVEAFVARVAALEEANEDLSLLCTGPWPPYSFVDA